MICSLPPKKYRSISPRLVVTSALGLGIQARSTLAPTRRLQAENAELRVSLAEALARDAEREAEIEKLRADFAVLQRMLFGRSSEKSRPEPPAGDGGGDDAGGGGGDGGQDWGRGSGRNVK